jgi:hypothetical protein
MLEIIVKHTDDVKDYSKHTDDVKGYSKTY